MTDRNFVMYVRSSYSTRDILTYVCTYMYVHTSTNTYVSGYMIPV